MYNELVESSLSAVLAAIEIYNKPQFSYREEVFTILLVNGWELLLKAKIIHDNNDRIEAIYSVKSDGTFMALVILLQLILPEP